MFRKGLLGYLPANILQGLVGFLALSVFTRLLSPDDYGRYALAFGVTSLAQTLFFTWIEAAMARFYVSESREDATASALFGTIYRLFIISSLIFGAVVAFGLTLWLTPTPESKALKAAIGLGLGAVIFRTLLKLVQEQRRAEGRVAAASLVDMVQTAGGFAIGLGLAYAGFGGGAVVLASGLIAVLVLPLVAREDWSRALKGTFDRHRAISYAQYGLPVAASLILMLALNTADRFIIAHYLGEAEVGSYQAGFSIASRIIDVLFIWFGTAGTSALVKALEHGGREALNVEAKGQIELMAFVAFPTTAGLIAVAPALCTLLIGEALRQQALSIIPMISLGSMLYGINNGYFLQAFSLTKQTRRLMISMAVPAIFNIALNIILIPKMGLQGAVWANLLSIGCGVFTSWLLGLHSLPLPLPLLTLFKIALCSVLMAMGVLSLPTFTPLIDLIIKPVVGVIIYSSLAFFLDLLSIRRIIRNFWIVDKLF